jgi:poly(3-hydroxyalkanoate) depolymerase
MDETSTTDELRSSSESTGYTDIDYVTVDGRLLRIGRRQVSERLGPPLLIFNGIGANLEILEPFVKALEGIEIVTFDVPGAGASPTPTLPYRYRHIAVLADHLMSYLGYSGEVDALGVSWGGGLAQQYAHLYPGRCRRLVLAGTSFGTIAVPARLSVLAKMMNPRRYYDASYLKQIAPIIYGGRMRRDPSLIEHHTDHVKPPNGRGYVYQLMAITGWSSLPWLYRLRQQTLIMAGADDPIIPLPNAKVFKFLIPKSQLVVFDDGHLFLMTSASEVAPIVQRFLA